MCARVSAQGATSRGGLLQCVAVCCSVLQCVAVSLQHTRVLLCDCNLQLQCDCTSLLCDCNSLQHFAEHRAASRGSFSCKCVVVCCRVLQCVAVSLQHSAQHGATLRGGFSSSMLQDVAVKL